MTKWYYSKEDLYKNIPKSNYVILAKDGKIDNGTKQYTFFESAQELVQYCRDTSPKYFNEVIPNIHDYPCYIYFDIDRELHVINDANIIANYGDFSRKLIDTFIEVFKRFMADVYQIPKDDMTFIEGVTYQVSYTPLATKKPKMSFHVKINIECPNVEIMKQLVDNLDKYMSSNKYISQDERDYFYFYKVKDKNQIVVPVIDKAVYANFRCYRMLYSAKWKSDGAGASVPFGHSSHDIADHLVLVHSDIESKGVCVVNGKNLQVPENHIDIEADYSKIDQVHIKEEIVPDVDAASEASMDITPNMTLAHLDSLETSIKTSPTIMRLLGANIRFKYSYFKSPSVYIFAIDKQCMCTCPYAQRVHSNNRSYLEYHFKHSILKYKCFNETDCAEKQKSGLIMFHIRKESDTLHRLVKLSDIKSLHCKQKIIQWNEKYDHDTMLPYPLKPITCIRGNMGAAKTQCLVNDFITKYAMGEHTKCLFITYQILLSNKYSAVLEQFGFVNYQNHQTTFISSNKVIVCLDSLWRVNTSNFDFVFVDEVLSVLLHFNSNLIKQVSKISSTFELLLLQAKYIYLLDACVDNSIVYNMVNYIASAKNVIPYWIWNTHVRHSNRRCRVIINKSNKKGTQKLFKVACMNKVAELVEQGLKVVVCSSTKTFTNQLELFLRAKNANLKILMYNSDTDKAIIHQHAINPNDIWATYDVLIYSPTISAGVSFEILHFDQMVAFLNKSFYTPTVDLALQQLFRVRRLKGGEMTLFVNDSFKVGQAEYPVCEEGVEEWLDANVARMQLYFPQDCLCYESSVVADPVGGLSYEKNRLSYHILKGIIMNVNKSLKKYTEILVNTLKEDYHIPCEEVEFAASESVLIESMKLYDRIKSAATEDAIPFDPDRHVISMEKYNELVGKNTLTREEKFQKWIYEVGVNMWQIYPDSIDDAFFTHYIGQYKMDNVKEAFNTFYKALRIHDMQRTLDENRGRMRSALDGLRSGEDYNLELYRSRTSKYYEMLLEGQTLIEKVFGRKDRHLPDDSGKEIHKVSTVHMKMKAYMETLNADRFYNIVKTCGLLKKVFPSLEKLKECRKNQQAFIKQMLLEVFGIKYVVHSRGSKKLSALDNEQKALCLDWYHDLQKHYKPIVLREILPCQYMDVTLDGYAINEEDDPLEYRP